MVRLYVDAEQPDPVLRARVGQEVLEQVVDLLARRELELALGSPRKFVAENEQQTVVVQRRSLRAARALSAGTVLTSADVEALRPAPRDGIFPYDEDKIIGKTLRHDMPFGKHFTWSDLI